MKAAQSLDHTAIIGASTGTFTLLVRIPVEFIDIYDLEAFKLVRNVRIELTPSLWKRPMLP